MIALNRGDNCNGERRKTKTLRDKLSKIKSDSPNYYERLFGQLDDEGRALANLLVKEDFLYNDLVRMGYKFIPAQEADREDFLQDFFLHITKYASTFNETFIGVDNLREYDNGRNWLVICLRNYVSRFWEKQFGRIEKGYKKPRAKEIHLGAYDDKKSKDNGKNQDRLSKLSYEVYLRNKGIQFPGRMLLEQEELEYKTRIVRETVEDSLKRLTKSEREVFKLYYFEGLSCEDIAKRKIPTNSRKDVSTYITNGSARTHLLNARKRLKEFLPSEIYTSHGWI